MARQRGSNFSTFEKMLVTELMEEFGVTIEDKRTDNSTLEKKERSWVQLADRFNGSTGIKETRDRAQLKACWKNLKAKAKKDAAEERRSQFQTGGGPPINATDALSKKIIDMIPQQISPLPNPYDDDGALDDRTTKEAASK